jgi:hypothetical protein
MLYLLEVNALFAAFVFAGAGLIMLGLFAWQEAKAYVAARRRMFQRFATFVTQPRIFANSFAISRSGSRTDR